MKKKILIFSAILFLSLISLASVNLLSPVGPTLVSIVGILEDKVDSEVKIDVAYWKSFDQITAAIVTGSADIIILPVTTGAALYNKDIPIELAAVTLWKGFYLVGKDVSVENPADLAGMEIYTPQGKGQTGDVLSRNYVKKGNLVPDTDVKIKYSTPPEIIGLLAQGKIKLAAIPEPFVTLSIIKAKAEILVDFQEEWGQLTGYERIPITGVFVRKDSMKDKPQEIVEALNSIRKSIEYSAENTQEAVKLTTNYFQGMPEAVLSQSMSRTTYEYVPASEIVDELVDYFERVQEIELNAMPEIPGEEFFAE